MSDHAVFPFYRRLLFCGNIDKKIQYGTIKKLECTNKSVRYDRYH
jgi:hypothetical protein